MAFEPLAEHHLSHRLGYVRVTAPEQCTPVARELLAALAKNPTISCGRNSAVEGVWMDNDGNPIVVEATGSPDESRLPGLVRSDNGRKLLGSAAQIALVCQREHVTPPGFLIVTTALPARGTSASGWVSGMLWLQQIGGLSALEIHLLDRGGRPVADLDHEGLRHYYERPRRPTKRGFAA